MDVPIIEFKDVTMAFKRTKRHYGFKATLLHPFQRAKDLSTAKEFRALDIMGTILFKPYQDLGEGLFFDN